MAPHDPDAPVTERERFRGCLLGLACGGDAVGTTLEFQPPGTFAEISDMVGGGPFGLAPGQWTDDTSMALSLATSLVRCGGFDGRDQMERYCRWADDGVLSSTGACFDIGNTTAAALWHYRRTGEPVAGPTDERSAGNGSIMRLAPIAMFYYPDEAAAVSYAAASSELTHGAIECLDACRLLASIVCRALAGRSKDECLFDPAERSFTSSKVTKIAAGMYRELPRRVIHGTGYVIESLMAALWCFHRTDTYADAVLLAANLGDDADTTAAVCGQLAGAFYGERGIPQPWRERVAMVDHIRELADALYGGRTRRQ